MGRRPECARCGQLKAEKQREQAYCRECMNAYYRERRRIDPKYDQRQQEWWRNNKDRAKKYKRKSTLKSNYGLTVEQYNAMLEAQNGCCDACGQSQDEAPKQILYVDHDHDSGVVRGLLCARCNFALGQLDDSVEKIMRLAAYLRRHQSKEKVR